MFRTLQNFTVFSLTRGLIILEESVCQHCEVGCQAMLRAVRKGCLGNIYHLWCLNISLAHRPITQLSWGECLTHKALCEQAQREKHQIPLKPLKTRLGFTHRSQAWKVFHILKCFWRKQIQPLLNLKLTMLSVKLRDFIRQKIYMKTHICLSVKCLCLRPEA